MNRCIYHSLFIQLPDMCCFHILAVRNNTAINFEVHVPFKIIKFLLLLFICLFPSGKYLGVELLDHMVFLNIHRQVWVSPLWGHCSFLLGPGAHKALFMPSKSLFPQSCVSSGGSMLGLMATSSKRAYAIPRSATPRAPAPVAGHCRRQTLKGRSGSASVGTPGCTRFCLSPPSISDGHAV